MRWILLNSLWILHRNLLERKCRLMINKEVRVNIKIIIIQCQMKSILVNKIFYYNNNYNRIIFIKLSQILQPEIRKKKNIKLREEEHLCKWITVEIHSFLSKLLINRMQLMKLIRKKLKLVLIVIIFNSLKFTNNKLCNNSK